MSKKARTSTEADEPKTDNPPEAAASKAPPEAAASKAPVKAPAVRLAKAVKAVFVPVGHVNVHLETPSGNEYNLVPREVFTIAAEDVEWFFTEWNWSFRQRLVRASDYKPTCGYHDPKAEAAGKAKAEAESGEKE